MSYANILVSVDLDAGAAERVRLAADLARRFGATLTGAAAHKVPPPILVQDIEDARLQDEANTHKVRAVLEQARVLFAEAAGSARSDWLPALAGPITHLVALARAADLLVLGRRGPDDVEPGPLGVPPGPILMEAGRPVLVVPRGLDRLRAERVVVAWKDGPEARRAVSAALPFLRAAETVLIASAGEACCYEGAEAVAAHLVRHGARATTHLARSAASDGEALMRFAADAEADLIVMGAYGHSRLREWMFGGVTRDILQRSPTCCLMSH